MHVIFAGMTGSGKTTHARAVAQRTGLHYVSGSAIRAKLAGLAPAMNNEGFWREASDAAGLDRDRLLRPQPRDTAVENELIAIARGSEACVFDTWVLPWLFRTNALCIYLRSPIQLRVSRVSRTTHSSPSDTLAAIRRKDRLARRFFKAAYDVDIALDMSPFDIVVDSPANADVPQVSTDDTSSRLIRIFRAVSTDDIDTLTQALTSTHASGGDNIWIAARVFGALRGSRAH